MTMPKSGGGSARLWYGRMFLPPNDAISERHGISFGEVKKKMVRTKKTLFVSAGEH